LTGGKEEGRLIRRDCPKKPGGGVGDIAAEQKEVRRGKFLPVLRRKG